MYVVNYGVRFLETKSFKLLSAAKRFAKGLNEFYILKIGDTKNTLSYHRINLKSISSHVVTNMAQQLDMEEKDLLLLLYGNIPIKIKNNLIFVLNKRDLAKTLFVSGGTASGYYSKGIYYSASGKIMFKD